MNPRILTDEDIKQFVADMKAIARDEAGAPKVKRKKLRVMTDKEVEDFAQRLIDAGKNGEIPEADVPENEIIDMTSENIVMMLKKR